MDLRIDPLSTGVDRFEDNAGEQRRKHRHPKERQPETEIEDRYEPSEPQAESDDQPAGR